MFQKENVNLYSKIAEFIYNNPFQWKELLQEKGISFHNKDKRYIFNYDTFACDFSDPIVQEARGIILEIDEENGSIIVICWPFRKFGNFQEGYIDIIDWNSAKVQEKIDGSIIKLYFYKDNWIFSTNGKIDAFDAPLLKSVGTFYDLILKCNNYKNIPFDTLDKNYTYIFELTTKENKVVIDYEEDQLYHIGTKNNFTGKEISIDIGIIKPKEYELNSLEKCIEAAKQLNSGNKIKAEGFVVVDKNYNRIKIKSPAYIGVHHLATQCITKKHYIETLLTDFDLTDYIKNYTMEVEYSYYKYEFAKMKKELYETCIYAKNLYEEYHHDRKAIVKDLLKCKYSDIGFKYITNSITVEEYLKQQRYSFFDKAIKTYEDKKIWE